jgi:hypothetical protein
MNEYCCLLESLKRRIRSRHGASSGGCFESDLSVQRTIYLERFKKYCSHPAKWKFKPGLLIFRFVPAQSQVPADMLLRQSLAKSPSRTGHQFPAPSGHNIF